MFDSHFLRRHYISADVLPHTYHILPNETIKYIHEELDTTTFSLTQLIPIFPSYKTQSQTSSERLMYVQLTIFVQGVYETNAFGLSM